MKRVQKTHNASKANSSENRPMVSIVITTKNEAKHIANCLDSISKQSYQDLEIILVDDYSTDKTVEITKKYTNKIFLKESERSAGRNYGAKVALGKYLIYLDADMILTRKVIEECVLKCEKQGLDALYVPERILGEGFWIKVRDFERSFYTGTLIDAVRFIRRDLFLQVDGFDETLIGAEDWDLDKKTREIGRTSIISSPLFHNEGKFNFNRYLKKKAYYTEGIQKYIGKWGSNNLEIAKQVGMRYRLMEVFIEEGKWKKLVRHPVYLIAMYSLRLMVALEYLRSAKQVTS